MKTIKHVLLWGFSLFCFFSFTVTSFANTATSQAGISFTEKEDMGAGNTSLPKNKDLPNTGVDRTSSKLPQTGETADGNLLIIGLVFLGAAIAVEKLRTKRGGRRMKLKTMTMLGLIGTGMLVGTSIADAAEPQDEVKGSADGKGGTSHGYINLVPGDTDTGKTDPEEPTV
ncbi:LPXTG cell wall anchor domain-containing protein, partial [Carnobacterium maltaromaticum]|uniref:LPXTG cell wall anchor domain-containing protein n=1 Tax=Carnobacterium maltaromaticum TaxID=2751 RepID=UPI00295E8024